MIRMFRADDAGEGPEDAAPARLRSERVAGLHGLKQKVVVPVGIERVLYLAAGDAAFRERLLADREAAVAGAGLRLTPTEAAVLASLPPGALAQMIDRVSLPDHGRRRFMKAVAASLVTLAAGSALSACEEVEVDSGPAPTGILPDSGVEVDAGDAAVDGGILSDSGVEVDAGDAAVDGGILADSGE